MTHGRTAAAPETDSSGTATSNRCPASMNVLRTAAAPPRSPAEVPPTVELHRSRVRGRRVQRGFRHEHHDERRYADAPDGARSELGEKEPLLAIGQGCQRGCAHGIKRPRAGHRRSHAGFAAEIDHRQVHGRDAGDESCRQIPGPRADRHDRELPVDCDDGMAGPPLVRSTLRSRDLLDPRSGGETCRAKPPRCVALKLLARVPAPGDAQHKLRETLGEEGFLLDVPADLRGGDLRVVLGVQPRVSLAEQAGSEEGRNGQREDQRYHCNLPRPHARPPGQE